MSIRRKLPPLNALKAFEAAARLGGFTAAGLELFVSPGAVSRHVANLETFLGTALFLRRHNEVSITPEGAEYLVKIRAAMDAIEDASLSIAVEATSHKLHINSLPTFATRWLIPRLARFISLHPRTEIRLSTTMEETDWDTDHVDISIYASLGIWPQRGDKLFTTSIQALCSPVWLAREKITTPDNVNGQMLLSSVSKTHDWPLWFQAAGLPGENMCPRLQFGSSTLAYQAAIDNLGMVCGEARFIEDDLQHHRLVAPFPHITAAGSTYFVEVHPNRKESGVARAFHEWILAEAAATP